MYFSMVWRVGTRGGVWMDLLSEPEQACQVLPFTTSSVFNNSVQRLIQAPPCCSFYRNAFLQTAL